MPRFQARNVPFTRLYNAVVYSVSALIYTGILAGLEFASPGSHVFLANAPQRDPFILIAICSWASLVTGAVCVLALYFPSKPHDKGRSKRYPEVTMCVLVMFVFSFLAILAGLAASAGAAVLVYFGGRDRYRVVFTGGSNVQSWLIPIATGILPAIFFVFMAVGIVRGLAGALKDMRLLMKGGGDAPRGDVTQGVPLEEDSVGLDVPLTPEEEEKVLQLAQMGFNNRNANVAALQASGFDVTEASWRLQQAALEQSEAGVTIV